MDPKQAQTLLRGILPLAEHMDVEVLSAGNEQYRCRVPLNDNTKNHFNSVHAALQWAGAELLGGVIWLDCQPSSEYLFLMKEMTIRFLKPAMTDVIAEAQFSQAQKETLMSTLKKEGKVNFSLSTQLKNTQGDVVAETEGQYAIRADRLTR